MEDDLESKKYTFEQKIVSAVWVHEKIYNHQTWKDIQHNFQARFNLPPPKKTTLMNWERKLFTTGSLKDDGRSGRPCARLMHVPYVKASLDEAPDLSLRERAKSLGLPRSTLLKILKDDLNMQYDPGSNEEVTKRICYNTGQWKEKDVKIENECDNECSV